MRASGVDVYLLPAVVGGGHGDVEEVLAAGRRLAAAGAPLVLYRWGDRPLPPGVEGPWDWPRHVRLSTLAPRSPYALTITSSWGTTAAPERPGRWGRAGPWSREAEEIERGYGADRTLHVSFEEFGRTLTSSEATRERLREGGVPARELPRALARARRRGEVAAFARAYATFRAFDRPNLLHLYTTFLRNPGFAREFPASVQTGPLWPRRYRARTRPSRPGAPWLWYASPASSERIAFEVAEGLRAAPNAPRLAVRSGRTWERVPDGAVVRPASPPEPPEAWRRRFAGAAVRIVTGSRTLLEALEVGGPWLYFNGVLGSGSARRRHRPEKLQALLAAARHAGWPRDLLGDLADFSRGRRVAEVVARVARREGSWSRAPPTLRPVGFREPFDDAGTLLVTIARSLAQGGHDTPTAVAELRARSNR